MGIAKTVATGVAVIGIGSGVYYYEKNHDAQAATPTVAASSSPAPTQSAPTNVGGRTNIVMDLPNYQFGQVIDTEIPYGKAVHVIYPPNPFGRTDVWFTAVSRGSSSSDPDLLQ